MKLQEQPKFKIKTKFIQKKNIKKPNCAFINFISKQRKKT